MNKRLAYFVAAIGFIAGIESTNAQSENHVSGTEAAWQQAIKKDPSLVQKRQQMELQIYQYLQAHKTALASTDSDSDEVRIIPTVFHILQEGGPENITNEQVWSCINIANADYRRQNADTVNTPAAFRPVAADTKIEFRLATLDPNGNCTNGITRTFTHRTENFDDWGKSIIDWPADNYLNIWVVESISAGGFPGGEIIGYAQYPGSAPPGTDGIVLRNDFVGTIGTGQTFYAGRDIDLETGHYLNVLSLLGDPNCLDDDSCADTPPQSGVIYGCPAFPDTSCGNSGDMTDNYMESTDGDCQNIWTQDQKARMRATLDVARFNLWQQSNLVATGTDSISYSTLNADSINPLCAPKSDFLPVHKNICVGSSINFTANTTNGTPTSWNWTFPGGTPPSSTVSNPTIVYNAPGIYSVTLTASNAQGSSTFTRNDVAIVGPISGQDTLPFFQGFEDSLSLSDWVVFNDDGGPGWQRTNRASYSGSYCFSVQNFETDSTTAPGSYKEFDSPSFDFTNINNPLLSFRLSYGQQYSGNLDSLSIGISTNCGATFSELKRLTGSALAAGSGGFEPNDFVPSHDQWSLVQIQLTTYYAGMKNVKFHFLFVTGLLSNNIYIDDININNGSVGINEEDNKRFNFNVYPNPASESFNISYQLKHAEDLIVNLYDLQGRLIKQLENKHESPGIHESKFDAKSFHLASGVYMLKMITPDGVISKELVYSND